MLVKKKKEKNNNRERRITSIKCVHALLTFNIFLLAFNCTDSKLLGKTNSLIQFGYLSTGPSDCLKS